MEIYATFMATPTFAKEEADSWAGPAGWEILPPSRKISNEPYVSPRKAPFHGAWRSAKFRSAKRQNASTKKRDSCGSEAGSVPRVMLDAWGLSDISSEAKQEWDMSFTNPLLSDERSFAEHLDGRPRSQTPIGIESSKQRLPVSARTNLSTPSYRCPTAETTQGLHAKKTDAARHRAASKRCQFKSPVSARTCATSCGGRSVTPSEDPFARTPPASGGPARCSRQQAGMTLKQLQWVLESQAQDQAECASASGKAKSGFHRSKISSNTGRLGPASLGTKRMSLDHTELLEPSPFTLSSQVIREWKPQWSLNPSKVA